jgi:acetyl-CoA acetyltransferase
MKGLGAITGVGDAGISFRSGRPAIDLAAEAALEAVADAGLQLGDIDGLAVGKGGDLVPADRPSVELADYLGLTLTWTDTTLVGGVSPIVQIGHAAEAISAGRCRRVLVVYASAQATNRERSLGGQVRRPNHHVVSFERSSGLPFPIGPNALAAARHMWQYGSTSEQLSAVAQSDRAWAALNPAALRPTPLSTEEAASSPMICAPLRKVDCCLISDGAGAVVVEAAAAGAPRGVSIRGFAEMHRQYSILSTADLLTTGACWTGPAALRQAGCTLADIGLLQVYDAFTILPIVLVENLGFAEPGCGGVLFAEGHTVPGGRLPTNTQGGGLAHCHPGFYGVFLVLEAVRQVRGETGARQVPDPRVALVQGAGGGAFGGSQATLVLAAE